MEKKASEKLASSSKSNMTSLPGHRMMTGKAPIRTCGVSRHTLPSSFPPRTLEQSRNPAERQER